MKQLTKIGTFLVLSIFAFTSCNNDGVFPADDDASALADFMFLATTNDTTSTGRSHGKCNVTEVAITDLPAAVTSYITANYAGATIDRAGKLDNGNFVVKVTKADATHTGLVFDAAGAFVSEKTHKGGKGGTPVAVADLSATIKAYIAANYAGATAEKAFTNAEGKFFVVIKKADATFVGLGFNADGSFISEMSKKRKGGHGGKSKG